MFITIIAFIFVLGLLVLVHEAGHFWAARIFKVKVEEFAFGFPPRLFSWKRGETKYSINAIPIGGYVKMLGELEKSKDPRAFENQAPWKRLVISLAGVLMNFALAWVLLSVCFASGTYPITSDIDNIPGEKIIKSPVVYEVLSDSAAGKSGIIRGDEIESIVYAGELFRIQKADDLIRFTSSHKGEIINITLKRENSELIKEVVLGENESPLGVSIVENMLVKVPWYQAPIVALRETVDTVKLMFQLFGEFFSGLFARGDTTGVGGPIQIFMVTGTAAKAGVVPLLQLTAILSLNLMIINAFPFPALDGGRAMFVLIETIFRRKIVKEQIENIIHTVGFAVLLLAIIAVSYKDIISYFK